MKNAIVAPLFLTVFTSGFCQELRFDVQGTYSHPVKREILNKAETMGDIIPYYPSAWILGYVSTEILTMCNGKSNLATGSNETLTAEQKEILQNADLGRDIVININYRRMNSVTNEIDVHTIHYSATIVPEIEAEFPGGKQPMTQFLKENAINKIEEKTPTTFLQAKVKFTVNENGKIADAEISATSGDADIDQLLLDVITHMPEWKPAEIANGIKVKQEFEFSVGNGGC